MKTFKVSLIYCVTMSLTIASPMAYSGQKEVKEAIAKQKKDNAASLIQAAYRAHKNLNPRPEVLEELEPGAAPRFNLHADFSAEELSQNGYDPEHPDHEPLWIGSMNQYVDLKLSQVLEMPIADQIDTLLDSLVRETYIGPKHMRTIGTPGDNEKFLNHQEKFYYGIPALILKEALEKNRASRAVYHPVHSGIARYYLNRMIAIARELGANDEEIYSPEFITKIQIYSQEIREQAMPLDQQVDRLLQLLSPKYAGAEDRLSSLGFPAKAPGYMTVETEWSAHARYREHFDGHPARILDTALKSHPPSPDPLQSRHKAIAQFILRRMKGIAKQMGKPELDIFKDEFVREISQLLPLKQGAIMEVRD